MRKLGPAVAALALLAAVAALPAAATHAAAYGRIAFSANVKGTSEVFTIAPDGTGLTQVTHGKPDSGYYGLAWTPDGGGLLYQVTGKHFDILYKAAADGSGAAPWSPPCTGQCLGDDYPAYSPSGRKVAFERAFGPIKNNNAAVDAIFTANADGSGLTQLTQKKTPTTTEDHKAAWSPNGKQIAFERLNTIAKPQNVGAIYVMNANGSDQHRLTPLTLDASNAHWSPDGKSILFSSHNETTEGKDANIYSIRANGSAMKQITHYTGGKLQAILKGFSPDGRQILFHLRGPHENAPGFNQLFVMNADGTGIHQLTHLPSLSDPGGGVATWGTAG